MDGIPGICFMFIMFHIPDLANRFAAATKTHQQHVTISKSWWDGNGQDGWQGMAQVLCEGISGEGTGVCIVHLIFFFTFSCCQDRSTEVCPDFGEFQIRQVRARVARDLLRDSSKGVKQCYTEIPAVGLVVRDLVVCLEDLSFLGVVGFCWFVAGFGFMSCDLAYKTWDYYVQTLVITFWSAYAVWLYIV